MYGIIFCFVRENIEIRIYYNKERPFLVDYIAVLVDLTETYSTYQVYEYNYFSESKEDVRHHIQHKIEDNLSEIKQHTKNTAISNSIFDIED